MSEGKSNLLKNIVPLICIIQEINQRQTHSVVLCLVIRVPQEQVFLVLIIRHRLDYLAIQLIPPNLISLTRFLVVQILSHLVSEQQLILDKKSQPILEVSSAHKEILNRSQQTCLDKLKNQLTFSVNQQVVHLLELEVVEAHYSRRLLPNNKILQMDRRQDLHPFLELILSKLNKSNSKILLDRMKISQLQIFSKQKLTRLRLANLICLALPPHNQKKIFSEPQGSPLKMCKMCFFSRIRITLLLKPQHLAVNLKKKKHLKNQSVAYSRHSKTRLCLVLSRTKARPISLTLQQCFNFNQINNNPKLLKTTKVRNQTKRKVSQIQIQHFPWLRKTVLENQMYWLLMLKARRRLGNQDFLVVLVLNNNPHIPQIELLKVQR